MDETKDGRQEKVFRRLAWGCRKGLSEDSGVRTLKRDRETAAKEQFARGRGERRGPADRTGAGVPGGGTHLKLGTREPQSVPSELDGCIPGFIRVFLSLQTMTFFFYFREREMEREQASRGDGEKDPERGRENPKQAPR